MARKPFSLTYVTYEEGDSVGLVCALLALAPVFIIVAYATLLVSRRELHVFYILAGQLANGALNGLLKAYFDAPRPEGADRAGPGFPSDHAQFMGFWAAYAALFLILYVPRVGRPYWRELLGAAVVALAAAVAGSRVYLGYHSADQVCAGLGFGSVFAAGWIEAYGRLLRPRLGGWVRDSPVCRYLLVRDCAHVADVLQVDYDAAMRRLGSSSPRKKRS